MIIGSVGRCVGGQLVGGGWVVGSVVGGFNKILADVCERKIFPFPNEQILLLTVK